MSKYHPLGEVALIDFENWARASGTSLHTYLSDGDRGHKVWAFYMRDPYRKYVSDGIRSGYYEYGKPTIYEALRAKLGREPTHKELCDDVRRILRESTIERAKQGKPAHQKGR